MNRLLFHIIIGFGLVFLSGCDIDDELGECPYNARLEYWYTGSGQANVLPAYVYSMDEFVFDENGILRQINKIAGDNVVAAELHLLPGSYSLITWANIDSASHVGSLEIGKTTKEDMILYLDNPDRSTKAKAKAKATAATKAAIMDATKASANGNAAQSQGKSVPPSRSELAYHGNAEPLYYGEVEFTIAGRGVSRQRVDMAHSHFKLDLVVKWKSAPPANTGDFNLRLYDTPSAYSFASAKKVSLSVFNSYAPAGGGSDNIVCHIPQLIDRTCNHRVEAKMGLSRTLPAQFITYRLTNDSHPLLCVYAGDTPLMKEIDLYKYFRTMNIDLDNNLRQEFSLEMEIDGDNVTLSAAYAGDWEDGGSIGSTL